MSAPRRLPAALASALLAVPVVTGCTSPDTDPTATTPPIATTGTTPSSPPTPTPTALTEDEAFRIAKETYRAYIAAVNDIDYSDAATLEKVYDLSSGSVEDSDRAVFTEYRDEGLRKTGLIEIFVLEPVTWDPATRTVRLASCLDISSVDVLNASGESIVSPDRDDIQSWAITLESVGAANELVVTEIEARLGEPYCA